MPLKNENTHSEKEKPKNPADLPVDTRYDGRLCGDGTYRNRWGCRFCAVEGCGLVSDWLDAGNRELCVFHIAASQCEAEMTEVLHKYRPLVILAKQFEKVWDEEDKLDKRTGQILKEGRKAQREIMDLFIELVYSSRFNYVPYLKEDGTTEKKEVPPPLARYQLQPHQRFVHPIAYLQNVALAHAEYLRAEKQQKADKSPSRRSLNAWRADSIKRKIQSLGATWTQAKPQEWYTPPNGDEVPF